jgi:hypothetical protein
MIPATHEAPSQARRLRGGWGLPALAIGALVLIVIAVIAIPLAGRQTPVLAPITTPEGVVQRFYDAIYRGDYTAAYAMLSDATQQEQSLADFQARWRYERESEMRIDNVRLHDSTATVTVTVTHFSPGGLFGGGEWSAQYDVLLERAGETWRIIGSPY